MELPKSRATVSTHLRHTLKIALRRDARSSQPRDERSRLSEDQCRKLDERIGSIISDSAISGISAWPRARECKRNQER